MAALSACAYVCMWMLVNDNYSTADLSLTYESLNSDSFGIHAVYRMFTGS